MLDECRTHARGNRATGYDATSDGITLTHLTNQAAILRDDLKRQANALQTAVLLDIRKTQKENDSQHSTEMNQAVIAAVTVAIATLKADPSDSLDRVAIISTPEHDALYDSCLDNIDGTGPQLTTAPQASVQFDEISLTDIFDTIYASSRHGLKCSDNKIKTHIHTLFTWC